MDKSEFEEELALADNMDTSTFNRIAANNAENKLDKTESDLESSLTSSLNASDRIIVPVTTGDDNLAARRSVDYSNGQFGQRSATESLGADNVPLLDAALRQHQQQPRKKCCVAFLCSLTVEPWLFLFTTSLFITIAAVKNLTLDKVCLFSFGYNDTECNSITNATIENQVQVRASNVDMYSALVDTIPSIVFSLFLGAFSDRRGRKLAMVIPVAGYVLSTFTYMTFAFYMDDVSPELLPLAVIFRGVSGGVVSAIVAALSYVSDRTTPEKRTIRMALVEASFVAGQPIGQLVAGQVYPYSPVLVFAIALVLGLLALILVTTTISNDLIKKKPLTDEIVIDQSAPSNSFCADLFDVRSLRETFRAIFKRRDNNARFHILVLLIIVIIVVTPSIGQMTIMFLYTRLRFGWSFTTYTYFTAVSTVISSLGLGVVATIVVHILKVPDKYLAPIGILGMITSNVFLSFSNTPLYVYLSIIPLPICGLCLISVRSQISKLVPQDEQGKIFSVAGSCDALVPLISSVLYTRVYNSTEAFFPEACFVMSVGIYVVALILSVILLWDSRRSDYVIIEEPPLAEPHI